MGHGLSHDAWLLEQGQSHAACDAAHAIVPHHGQGANQSIEAAVVLADDITSAGFTASTAAISTNPANARAEPGCDAGFLRLLTDPARALVPLAAPEGDI